MVALSAVQGLPRRDFRVSELSVKTDVLNRKDSNVRKILNGNRGQGLVEYSLICLLVTLVFWVGIKNTNIGPALTSAWDKITTCVTSPFDCEAK